MRTVTQIELWGGVECTVARVGGRIVDQIRRTGHEERPDDLNRFAALGLRTLRYPVLWERVAPDGLDRADWTWSDERLGHLRELGIAPIVGLVHHGAGPLAAGLLDDGFAAGLAAYAEETARRYPWVDAYTPVNEPLTTARFSALYGHWHPHLRDARAFVRALLNQIDGTDRAMRAIRRVTPSARLVQTEDAGRTFSSPRLRYQADFENHRRWLTFDLLAGRVDRQHPLRRWLLDHGADARLLDRLVDTPTPADCLGLNYYLTSDRFLDHRAHLFPADLRGGNGRDEYADVEAVRMPAGIAGHTRVLLDAWLRYRTPVAITEAHAGCDARDQVRWLAAAWRGAHAAQLAGADVRAATAWALVGSVDWASLLTEDRGQYEPGAFDARHAPPRPTPIAVAIRALARGKPLHAYGDTPGWWDCDEQRLSVIAGWGPSCAPLLERAEAGSGDAAA